MNLLHIHMTRNGVAGRCAARLINAFGRDVRHTIVSAHADAGETISKGITVNYPKDFPSLDGAPLPGRLMKLARAMKGFDLVLTYGGGAMAAVLAHTLFAQSLGLPPLIHHEDMGDEAGALRNWYRRIALGRVSALIVPTERLESVALSAWQQPRQRVRRIAPGVDVAALGRKPAKDTLPRVIKRPGEFWLGALADAAPGGCLSSLLGTFASLPEEWQFVILGGGAEQDAIRAEALRLEVAHRLHFPGRIADSAKAMGLFDVFVMPSASDAFPVPVVQAMAAGLPVCASDSGELASIVAPANRPFLVPVKDEAALAKALQTLANDAPLRKAIGEANRARARSQFDETGMIAAYRAVYAEVLGRSTFP